MKTIIDELQARIVEKDRQRIQMLECRMDNLIKIIDTLGACIKEEKNDRRSVLLEEFPDWVEMKEEK